MKYGSDRSAISPAIAKAARNPKRWISQPIDVEPVPMPESVAVWLSAYVAAYHVEEPFRKRQRRKLDPREIGFGRRDGGRA